MRHSTRREVVVGATATALTVAVPPAWGRLMGSRPRIGPGRFADGVASGEPGPTTVTLWSRLRTDRPRSGARVIVARDPGMRRVVASAVVPTGRGVDHTLKARIGGLDPHTEYFYAWESGTDTSPVGRTRTRPHPSSSVPLRIGFSSCQHYSLGYFSPHTHAATEDLDVYLFLGDYVYERGRDMVLYGGRYDPINANDLGSYRRKYQLYRRDPGLRELHRVHPALHVWDDHEVENNYTNNNPAPAALQRSAGYRAALEWLPRVVERSDRYRIYKRLPFGRTAEIFLLDTRQYRTGDGDGQPRRMLGDTQMNWLLNGLRNSRARWKIIAQQVVVAANAFGDGPRDDKWDGYPEDRARMLGEIERAGITNVVFLTGDAHAFMFNLLASDFGALGDGARGRMPAAVEYVGGSVTSLGPERSEAEVQAQSPWVRQYNSHDHGYALLSMDGEQLVTDYRRSDLSHPEGASQVFERFVQPSGVNNAGRGGPPPT